MEEPKPKRVGDGERGFLSIIVDLFRSLKLTIFLFILLAIVSIIGTMITQNAPSDDYIQRYGPGLYEVLDFFGLFDMYHSWWFSTILILLVINLVTCSLQRLPGAWRQVFRESGSGGLEDSMLKTLPYVERVRISNPGKAHPEEHLYPHLKKWFGNPEKSETESSVTLFSEKGRFSRLGVYITHLSIIVILIGGLVGSFFGFKGFVSIPEGETINQIYLRVKDREVPKPIDFSIRCNDFKVTYYDLKGPQKQVKEYSSLLTVLENGKEVLKKTILVNHPLHYKGLSFYQSSYGTLHDVTLGIQYRGRKDKAVMKAVEGETVPVPNSSAFVRVLKYAPQIHNLGEGVQVAYLSPNQPPRVFWVVRGAAKPDELNGGLALSFEGVTAREYTGLQVTRDPGVWVVWIGCGLMIFGLIVSFFFSHQRVWVKVPREPGGDIVVAGTANKNRVGFEGVFNRLVKDVRSSQAS